MSDENREALLFKIMKEQLYTPVVGDILDQKGYTHQFLPQNIHPLFENMKIAGKAMPVLLADVYGIQEKPFGLLTESLDELEENEIYVAGGGQMRCAYWGELLTAAAKKRGAVGAVVYGWHRDTVQILDQSWPVFSCGAYAQDSGIRSQVLKYRCPIEIGQVTVNNGDYVFGDRDGVLVIPHEILEEVISLALEKVSGEKSVRNAIENGMSATDAFTKYGIL